MRIQILFNSEAINKDLSVGWGFSCLINDKILFDTGEKADMLANNLNKLGIDVSVLESVVISHDHWDHTGGLEEILKRKPGLNVYSCPGFSEDFKRKVKSLKGSLSENQDFLEIEKDIYVTGEIIGKYKELNIAEQALVSDSAKGLVILTGCAHPGIIEIIDIVRTQFPHKNIYAVLGGFHLMNKSHREIDTIVRQFADLGIQAVGPTHCTGVDAINAFKKVFKDNHHPLRVGESLEIL